ncbi:MAG: FAD-linked oxidase C-terminal domain-containing protein [Chitinophagales bacterium]
MRTLYATDASVYRELPLAVAYPKDSTDLQKLIHFAQAHHTSLIPRTAGTSLAGQCVGSGIVLDVSRYMNQVLEINPAEKWVWVQPGIIRDDLNQLLKAHNLWFSPNTSTSNRCMIGGMVGNNSCGSTSVKYGSTRDHLLAVNAMLHDGSEVTFAALDCDEFAEKCNLSTTEGNLYRHINDLLSDETNQIEIITEFPKESVHRRNTGYALDSLLFSEIFSPKEDPKPFNFCSLLAGSEGTLALFTAIKLQLSPLPPPHKLLVCGHFSDIHTALQASTHTLAFQPDAVEMLDHLILESTRNHLKYEKYRFFVKGNPAALICVELSADSTDEVAEKAQQLIAVWQKRDLGYAFPILSGSDIAKVWELRSAGLGLLANIAGDAKAVAVVEDTAVALEDLPQFIADFNHILAQYGKSSVHYGHAGAGELHLRPILNLKKAEDVKIFREIATQTAQLVKKYEGSNSGEHGDGRLRGEFLPILVGEHNYSLFKSIKNTWDPQHIFNPGKIVDTPPMDKHLRYETDQYPAVFESKFDFSPENSMLQLAEKCNGSGDCRRSQQAGANMCPTYMASLEEKQTTRARANLLREVLTQNKAPEAFSNEDLKAILDSCIACKACLSECPSKVDMSLLKSEFLYQYQKIKGKKFRNNLFAQQTDFYATASKFPSGFNLLQKLSAGLVKKMAGIASQRHLPLLAETTVEKWYRNNYARIQPKNPKASVYFFNDEFTNYLDAATGISAIKLLAALQIDVLLPVHTQSGRAQISKGLLDEARDLAKENVEKLFPLLNKNKVLIGVEPSAILGFRHEYPRLLHGELQEKAHRMSDFVLTVEEYLAQLQEKGLIGKEQFSTEAKHILLHVHCHQKALSSVHYSVATLSIPQNYHVEVIASACCGMAGSFGYEKENYEMSMKIGNMSLFPAVKKATNETIIAASGTSCRHQILDGTQKTAQHPVEILYESLLK